MPERAIPSDQRPGHNRPKRLYWLVSDSERRYLSPMEMAELHEQRMLRIAVCEEGRGVRVALVEIAHEVAKLNSTLAAISARIGGGA